MGFFSDLFIIFGKFKSTILGRILWISILLILSFYIFHKCSNQKKAYLEKTYVIGRSESWGAVELYGKEPNMTAFTTELLTIFSQEKEIKIKIAPAIISNIQHDLDYGKYDAILTTIPPESVTRDQYLFSTPIYFAGPVLVLPASSKLNSIHDLAGKPVGIQRGSPLAFKLSQESTALLVPYDTMVRALDDMENNVISGVIMEGPLAYTYANGFYSGKIKLASGFLSNLGIRLETLNNEDGKYLIDNFNETQKKLIMNGSYNDLIVKWGLGQNK